MDCRRTSTVTTADGGLQGKSVLDPKIQNLRGKVHKLTWNKHYFATLSQAFGIKIHLFRLRLRTVEAVEVSELPVLRTVLGTPDYPVSENVKFGGTENEFLKFFLKY